MKKAVISSGFIFLLHLLFTQNIQAFLPTDISGLTAWYMPESLLLNNNDPVSQWSDSTGNGFTLFQNDTSFQPKYTSTGINNLPTVAFSGHQELKINTNLCNKLTDQATLFIVSQINNDPAYNLVDTNPETGTWWRFDLYGYSYLGVFRQNRAELFTPMPDKGVHIFTLKSGTDYTFYTEGILQNNVTGNFSCGTTFALGGQSGGVPFTGDISEVLIYDYMLTDAQRVSVENYLYVKYFLAFPDVSPIFVDINPVSINTSINASATFTDADISETHTALWNWGDGNITNGSILENNGTGSISGNHLYTTAGIYTITLTITDSNSKSQNKIYQNLLVYNPNSGRIQAGKEFTTSTGTAYFSFTAKYVNGIPVPIGNKWATLLSQSENINFTATNYHALIIKDNNVILNGDGILNGASGYSFLISATDNGIKGSDFIRYQIKDSADDIVYDIQPDAPISAGSTTLVTDGRISIH